MYQESEKLIRSISEPNVHHISNLHEMVDENVEPTVFHRWTKESPQPSIRSLDWVLRFIDEVYNSRYQCFLNEIASLDGSVETFSSFVFNFVSKKFGLDSLVKHAAFELLESVKHYRFSNKQVELFGLFLTPYYSAIDLMFFLHVRFLTLKECVTGNRFPFENKRRQRKVGNVSQYIPGQRISFLTKKVLLDQPKALIDNCSRELNSLLKKRNQMLNQKQLLSPQNNLFRDGKLELYEYLIIILIHYKAFRDAKNSKGKFYFYTLMPEEVPAHHRRRDPKIQQYVLLRETKFHRNLLSSALKKKEMIQKQESRRYFEEEVEKFSFEDDSEEKTVQEKMLQDDNSRHAFSRIFRQEGFQPSKLDYDSPPEETGSHTTSSEVLPIDYSDDDLENDYSHSFSFKRSINEFVSAETSGENAVVEFDHLETANEIYSPPPLHSSSPRERHLISSPPHVRPELDSYDGEKSLGEEIREEEYHSDYFSSDDEQTSRYVVSADQEQRNDIYKEDMSAYDGVETDYTYNHVDIPKLDLEWLTRHLDQ